jgi:hypothetical protein
MSLFLYNKVSQAADVFRGRHYNIEDYQVFQHPSSGLHRRTLPFKNWICFHPQVKRLEALICLSPLQRDNLNNFFRISDDG